MSLDLDKRQRAMLSEMGVQVWLPETPVAAEPAMAAPAEITEAPRETSAAVPPAPARQAAPAPGPQPPQAAPLQPPVNPPLPAGARGDGALPAWHLGEAQPLYVDSADSADSAVPGGARWLVLAQTAAAALQGPVFAGDAGRLLDNMLRAARLHLAGAVLLAPVVRQAAGAPGEAFAAALAALIRQAQPDIVLVMGRMAGQAVLQSSEPLGRLRGQVHALHGARAVLTYDAPYLLRMPADKAKAWDDLRLAMGLVMTAGR